MITHFKFEQHFVTPIMKCQVNLPHAEIAQYCREKLRDFGKYTSYYDEKFNEQMKENLPHRRSLEQCLRTAGKLFTEERGIKTNHTLGYWFSVYTTGKDHILHTHPGATTAGTYYPHGDEKSSKIRFRHPAATLISHAETPNEDELFYAHYPKTGELNCWPSWLEHEVRPQGEVDFEHSRVAISFNYGKQHGSELINR